MTVLLDEPMVLGVPWSPSTLVIPGGPGIADFLDTFGDSLVLPNTRSPVIFQPWITAPGNNAEVEVTNMGDSPRMYQGDLLPALMLTASDVTEVDGVDVVIPLNLDQFISVTIVATLDGRTVISRPPTAINGSVATMAWQPADTAAVGTLRFRLEVTDDLGRERTVPMRLGFPIVARNRA